MDLRELAWAAGLFDGEGCFSISHNQRGRRQPGAFVTMTDEDSVRRFHKAVGVGHLRGPLTSKGGTATPLWSWSTGSFEGVQHTAAVLWFGLNRRRRVRAGEVLRGCS